jgi:hypothetical protein
MSQLQGNRSAPRRSASLDALDLSGMAKSWSHMVALGSGVVYRAV